MTPDIHTSNGRSRRAGDDRAPNDWAPGRMAGAGWGPPPEEGLLEQSLRIIRKHKWLILQATLLVPLLALVLSLLQTEKYEATSSLLFRDPPAGAVETSSSQDPSRTAATNEELISLPVVAERAAREIGGGVTKGEVESAVEVDSSGDADVLQIKATHESPRRAAAIANGYAEAYIDFRREADRARVSRAIDRLERDLRALPSTSESSSERSQLRSQLQGLRVSQSLGSGNAELVQRASVPSSASVPKTKRNVLLGLLLGGIFGFGLASMLERVDRRLKSEEELEEIYGLPILARVPRSRTLGKQARENPLRALNDALSQTEEAEAFRTLRANLRYFNVDRQIKSILIASPVQGEGKSTVANFLAVTMASMGDRVVLVEADLRKDAPGLMPDPGGEGLSLVLAGFDLNQALIEVPISIDIVSEEPRTLTRLPRGPIPPNPSELLESSRMQEVLAALEDRFDFVIIDSPALSSVADALSIVPQVSGVVVVSSLTETTEHAALNLRKQLALLGGHPLGVVANFASPSGSDYYYYYRSERGRRTPA